MCSSSNLKTRLKIRVRYILILNTIWLQITQWGIYPIRLLKLLIIRLVIGADLLRGGAMSTQGLQVGEALPESLDKISWPLGRNMLFRLIIMLKTILISIMDLHRGSLRLAIAVESSRVHPEVEWTLNTLQLVDLLMLWAETLPVIQKYPIHLITLRIQ